MSLEVSGSLNIAKNFPGVPPLLNFENFEAALLGSRSTQYDETLHAHSRGQVCKSAIGLKRIRDEKIFWTLLYGIFFQPKVACIKKCIVGKLNTAARNGFQT